MGASPVLHLPACDGAISCPDAPATEGTGSMGRRSGVGGGAAVLLSLGLEHGERRRQGRGDVAYVGQRGVAAAVLRDELHLLPEKLRQLSTLLELLDDGVSLVGGRRRRRWRHLRLGAPHRRHGGFLLQSSRGGDDVNSGWVLKWLNNELPGHLWNAMMREMLI